MTQPIQPTKQEVRKYMERRIEAHRPPPSLDEIRRQLGWGLIEQQRQEAARRR